VRVALISPPWYRVPPRAYGGTEAIVSLLAEGLVERGHDVTLFASGDSQTSAKLEHVYPEAPSERIGECVWELGHVLLPFEHTEEFEIVHDHSGPLALALLGATTATVIHTVHGTLDGIVGEVYRRIARSLPRIGLTSLSKRQRQPQPRLPWIATVPNAIPLDRYPLSTAKREDFLLFLGRMCPEKGADRAIEVARAAGRQLVIAAKCREPAELSYFQEYVQPHLGDGVDYAGEASFEQKIELLHRACATLVPLAWEEPFGLVMIESAACGTPVIATRRGSVPEVVAHGVSGIVVRDHRQMPSALKRALALNPVEMRAHVARHFSVEHMVSGYVAAYARAIERTERRRPRTLRTTATYPPATVAPVIPAHKPRAHAPKLGLVGGGDASGEVRSLRND
jgi:glycosyltransferase involved in cell wall biosynthesis